MSKRQIDLIKLNSSILLLGILMVNFWSSVLQASTHPMNERITSKTPQSPIRRNIQNENVVDNYVVDKEALNWVKNYADGIARFLYKNEVSASYENIAKAYQQLRGQSLDQELSIAKFVNENTKMYLEGAVQAFLDNIKITTASNKRTADDQRGVDAWLHAHAQALLDYFEVKKITFADNYAAIVNACRDLDITPLATTKKSIQQRILSYINNSLEGETGLLPEDDHYLQEILSHLRSMHTKNVNKKQLIKAAKDHALKLPKDFIKRLDTMPEDKMQQMLEELNKELSYDLDAIARALNIIASVGQQQQKNVAAAIDVIGAVSKIIPAELGREDEPEESDEETRYAKDRR